jgi:DNA-binding XRE family transcriptional regulator
VRFFCEDHGIELRWRHLADILLHEQIHQAQYQLGNPSKTKHDVEFAAMCNAVGDQLGLRHVVSRRRKGDAAMLPIAANWPMNVRPEGYYGDLWAEVYEPDQAEDWLSQILALWEAGAPPDQLEFLERIGAVFVGTSNGAAEQPKRDPMIAGEFTAEFTRDAQGRLIPTLRAQPSVTTSDDTPLHERVKAARLERGWSQKEVAKAVDVKQPVISNLENGRTVDDALMARILAALGES